MHLIARYFPHILIVVFYTAIVAVIAHSVGSASGDRRAAAIESKADKERAAMLEAYAQDVANARAKEQSILAEQRVAADQSKTREEQIHADYEARLAAAAAGHTADLGRLRKLWAASETAHLSAGAATAGELAETDRLRRESAARIVRAAELAQSERDEAVALYNALTQLQAPP